MKKISEILKINATWMPEQQIEYANQHRSDVPLFKGDLVYIDIRDWRLERPAKKLDDKFAGPWPITQTHVIPGRKDVEVNLCHGFSDHCRQRFIKHIINFLSD